MAISFQDTIVALATPSGAGARAIVRLSGPEAGSLVTHVLIPREPLPDRGRFVERSYLGLPIDVYFSPAPNSYTGQDVIELHALSCPPLLEELLSELMTLGARSALPGEFTQRAFLEGKLDLTRAEAVHAIIDAGSTTELKQALAQLAGGMARPLTELREDLLNLLADVEAGLDFADEDLQFVNERELLLRLGNALAHVTLIGKQLDSRTLADHAFRVALAGRPNAGKSSLFNALAGARALVSEVPGTTRDYLVARLKLGTLSLELIDTPGSQEAEGEIEQQAQVLGRSRQLEADLILWCHEAGEALSVEEELLFEQSHPPSERIATKSDLQTPHSGWVATSSTTGEGLDELRRLLVQRGQSRGQPALASSISRCKSHVTRCLDHLRRAHAIVLEQDPPEILAMELRESLQQLGEMVGAVYTDDLLDRVFSRFCIGK